MRPSWLGWEPPCCGCAGNLSSCSFAFLLGAGLDCGRGLRGTVSPEDEVYGLFDFLDALPSRKQQNVRTSLHFNEKRNNGVFGRWASFNDVLPRSCNRRFSSLKLVDEGSKINVVVMMSVLRLSQSVVLGAYVCSRSTRSSTHPNTVQGEGSWLMALGECQGCGPQTALKREREREREPLAPACPPALPSPLVGLAFPGGRAVCFLTKS